MSQTVIRVGSRESRLAVAQTQLVMENIRRADPALTLDLVTMKTTGDRILDRPLDQVGGKGLFVKELDAALLEGRVDLTVHSCKDLPMEENPALPLVAFSRREDPRDVLVLPAGQQELDPGLPVGCASRRRGLQWQALFPHIPVAPVRGNLQTRLGKLDQGGFCALILAAAGLKRLGLEGRIFRYFSPEEMLPAAGQGVLAVQARQGEDTAFLSAVHHRETALCVAVERAFVRAMDGGCSSPVAAYAVIENGELTLRGMDEQGRKAALSGPPEAGRALGEELARRMRESSIQSTQGERL
ncbi:MAG: hydroxymethylbilane synthase [Oscillospiraceae bacterium]|nr:hydroxymethylbilane synthase [Oscillospiraceae bacterium]